MKSNRILQGCVIASFCLLYGGAWAQVVTEFSAGITNNAQPVGITKGPDGNIWFTEQISNRIGRITPLGVVTEFSAGITGNAQPLGITSGPDGNLWFAEANGNRIGRITPFGVVTEFSDGITAGAVPVDITAGPDGNLWFTERIAGKIGRIDPLTGIVTEFSAGITSGAGPHGITAGPDGNLWFTEYLGNRIGWITPQGVVTEFSAGITSGAGPLFITVGPDGNLWFTEQLGNRIGRLAFSAPVLIGATSRKVHGAAGTFDLPLSMNALNPVTEPRQSSTATIVMTFDTPIIGASAAVTEGTATMGVPTFSGNDVILGLTGVTDQRYASISLTNVANAVNSNGSGSIRVGFLVGDVNQNRVVTVADLGLVNAQLAQIVTVANYLKDVNASGTLTVADKGVTNANLTRALPPP
jgi:hypothetical protein